VPEPEPEPAPLPKAVPAKSPARDELQSRGAALAGELDDLLGDLDGGLDGIGAEFEQTFVGGDDTDDMPELDEEMSEIFLSAYDQLSASGATPTMTEVLSSSTNSTGPRILQLQPFKPGPPTDDAILGAARGPVHGLLPRCGPTEAAAVAQEGARQGCGRRSAQAGPEEGGACSQAGG
jgi:hypothetical protein